MYQFVRKHVSRDDEMFPDKWQVILNINVPIETKL